MTRQIALGAVIAFAVTVLALSVWEPKNPPPPAPAAAVVDPAMPRQNLRPAVLRPEMIGRTVRLSPPVLQLVDAGAPLP